MAFDIHTLNSKAVGGINADCFFFVIKEKILQMLAVFDDSNYESVYVYTGLDSR